MTQDLLLRNEGGNVKKRKFIERILAYGFVSCGFWYLGCRKHFLIWEVLSLPLSPEPSPGMLLGTPVGGQGHAVEFGVRGILTFSAIQVW